MQSSWAMLVVWVKIHRILGSHVCALQLSGQFRWQVMETHLKLAWAKKAFIGSLDWEIQGLSWL